MVAEPEWRGRVEGVCEGARMRGDVVGHGAEVLNCRSVDLFAERWAKMENLEVRML